MQLRRKIDALFENWRVSPRKRPLVVKGPRQCGKTFSVLKFAREHYSNVVYINFFEDERYQTAFAGSLRVDEIIKRLTAVSVRPLVFDPGKTVLVLDEIQDCPEARTALKFFHLDGRFDVMCTGSLLGVEGYGKEPRSIPVGYENYLTMGPLDFEEFLWAVGVAGTTLDAIRTCFAEARAVEAAYHLPMRERLLEYAVVGGMPEAVIEFCRSRNIGAVREIQREILAGYRADMGKYTAREDRAHIVECFLSIPIQLAKENKKFQYSVVRKGAKASTFRGSLQWIEDAGIIKRCRNVSLPDLPLEAVAEQSIFKVYMSDPGLFLAMLESVSAADVLSGNLGVGKGAVFENLIAGILDKAGHPLYYFHKASGLELDFLIPKDGRCVPIEVKATTGNAKSLKTVLAHPEKYKIDRAIKLIDGNVGKVGSVLTLPHYMAFLI